MTSGWGVLLDLDETLILTASIEPLRRRRSWQEAYASFHRTSLPPGTREFITDLKRSCRIGVVTTSPRPYAERLLRHHELDLSVLVAYHDVTQRKPHPEPIIKGAAMLGLVPARCIHVGDIEADLVAATAAGAVSFAINWPSVVPTELGDRYPDTVFTSWTDLMAAIEHVLSSASQQERH